MNLYSFLFNGGKKDKERINEINEINEINDTDYDKSLIRDMIYFFFY